MKVKELKEIIANLPNEMIVTAIDCAKEADNFKEEWLVIAVPQEPLFVMPVPYMRGTLHYYLKDNGDISFKQGNAYRFNGDQIDKYFPDIKKLAVPVKEDAE